MKILVPLITAFLVFSLSVLAEEYEPIAAAGEHHLVKFENENVRVLEVVIQPGDTVPFHQHTMESLFITLEPTSLVFRDLEGNIVKQVEQTDFNELPHYDPRKGAPAPRSVENTDSVVMKAIRIEFK